MRIVEVGPRDGLQNVDIVLEPRVRAELVGRLLAAGLSRIEAVSFVRSDRVPQMADAEAVVSAVQPELRPSLSGLVLNERGLDRLLAAGLADVRFTFAVSDTFNQRNSNASTREGLSAALRVLRRAQDQGVRAGVVLATSFGCPFEGHIAPSVPLRLAEQLVEAGAREIVFADTIGVATPQQVREVVIGAGELPASTGIHLHNTRGFGYLNAYVAIEAGADMLDTSIGGLGGCPFAPGASGNIATEDLVYLCEREGLRTGIDLDRLITTARWLRASAGVKLEAAIHRAPKFPPERAGAAAPDTVGSVG